MFEINNLRVLNDYLNQTIEVLLRAQRFGTAAAFTPGLSHSPYVTGSIFGAIPAAAIDPTYAGLSHSPYAAQNALFGVPVNAASFATAGYPTVVDAFGAQRGLTHTSALAANALAANAWTWPVAEIARQSQITQAIAARQTALEAMCRAAGLTV